MKKYKVIENGCRVMLEIEALNIDEAILKVKSTTGIPSNMLYSDIYEFREVATKTENK